MPAPVAKVVAVPAKQEQTARIGNMHPAAGD
jgi:hypothetical protein